MRTWILAVTCAAAVASLAEALTPRGAIQKVVRLISGLLLTLTILQPVLKLDEGTLRGILADYHMDTQVREMDIGVENMRLIKSIIEEETGAYILDKAKDLGLTCEVRVECEIGEGEELPVPRKVTVTGSFSDDEREELARFIESELAIPREEQIYEGKDQGE